MSKALKKYADQKGPALLAEHASDFIKSRLAPEFIPNDGKQTPLKGHPVFIAQHACACCCRDCLHKWYHIPKGRELSDQEQKQIIALLMRWISREMEKYIPPAPTKKPKAKQKPTGPNLDLFD